MQQVLALFDRASALGRLSWQYTLNSLMVLAVVLLASAPWWCLLVVSVLALVTGWVHWLAYGKAAGIFLGLFGVLGMIAEWWAVLGGVWAFNHAGASVGGVPFYMLPVWSMVGALAMALWGWLMARLGKA
jgi:hypothetical protein